MARGETLTCYCGDEFTATNNRQKYCSTKCAQRLLQKRWIAANQERHDANRLAWRKANPDKIKTYKQRTNAKRGTKPRGLPRQRPVTPRMPLARSDAKEYYLTKQLNDRLVRAYGITLEDFQRMHDEQGGVCAICRKPETQMVRRKTLRRLCVDHNKRTGRVRALLCAQCNLGIGNSQEDSSWFEAAAAYLRRWNVEEPPEGG